MSPTLIVVVELPLVSSVKKSLLTSTFAVVAASLRPGRTKAARINKSPSIVFLMGISESLKFLFRI